MRNISPTNSLLPMNLWMQFSTIQHLDYTCNEHPKVQKEISLMQYREIQSHPSVCWSRNFQVAFNLQEVIVNISCQQQMKWLKSNLLSKWNESTNTDETCLCRWELIQVTRNSINAVRWQWARKHKMRRTNYFLYIKWFEDCE